MSRQYRAYIITCPATGKCYVGITGNTVASRWSRHLYTALRTARRSPLIDDIRKYGADAFTVEHVASSLSQEAIRECERLLIVQWGTFAAGYNTTAGGEPFTKPRGRPMSAEETRRRLHTPEVRAKIRKAVSRPEILEHTLARLHSPESRTKAGKSISRTLKEKGTRPPLDRPEVEAKRLARLRAAARSEENRQLRSRLNTGRKQSPEWIAKKAKARRGKLHSELARYRLWLSHGGGWLVIDDKRYPSVAAAAKALGIGRRFVERWVESGRAVWIERS